METGVVSFLKEVLGKKDTSYKKRHKVDVRVVPFEDKKGTSKAKKEQAGWFRKCK